MACAKLGRSCRWSVRSALPASGGGAAACAGADSSDWQFTATIYGWFPDIGGHTELPLGGGGDIDVDISTILDHLKIDGAGFV